MKELTLMEEEMNNLKKVPDDLMTKAVAVKCILRFTRQDEWAQIIGDAILFERNEERNRAKKVVKEILSRESDRGNKISQWKKIETAPRDGTPILAADKGRFAYVAEWIPATGWIGADGMYWEPTHWMPLPEPPK